MTDWPATLLAQHLAREPYPSIVAADPRLDFASAYAIQRAYVALRNEPIAGFKAALTASQAQASMGVDVPIVGVLFESGARSPGKIDTAPYNVLLETELGFHADRAITQSVTEATVLTHFGTVSPMIEVACPNLSGKPNGLDLVATNSASFGYIAGQPVAADAIDVDAQALQLTHNGDIVLTGRSDEIMAGQRSALAWLVNQVIDLGYAISEGDLFMTGSVGGMYPGKTGVYAAEFGALGSIEFEI